MGSEAVGFMVVMVDMVVPLVTVAKVQVSSQLLDSVCGFT